MTAKDTNMRERENGHPIEFSTELKTMVICPFGVSIQIKSNGIGIGIEMKGGINWSMVSTK